VINIFWAILAAVAFICGIFMVISSIVVKKKDSPNDIEMFKKMRSSGIMFIVAGIVIIVLIIVDTSLR